MSKKSFAELIGWYGVVAITSAYFLVSFNIINADSLVFQLLNLTGAIGIIVISVVKNEKQTIVLNIFWASIALFALIRLAAQ